MSPPSWVNNADYGGIIDNLGRLASGRVRKNTIQFAHKALEFRSQGRYAALFADKEVRLPPGQGHLGRNIGILWLDSPVN